MKFILCAIINGTVIKDNEFLIHLHRSYHVDCFSIKILSSINDEESKEAKEFELINALS